MKNWELKRANRINSKTKFWREEWTIYILTIFLAWLSFVTSFRYYINKKILSNNEVVTVRPERCIENSAKSNFKYNIIFHYDEERYSQGIGRKAFNEYQSTGDLQLFYNQKLNAFLDPNISTSKVNSDLFFAILAGIGFIFFYKEIIFGKYNPWR